jgi:hypothetical protein
LAEEGEFGNGSNGWVHRYHYRTLWQYEIAAMLSQLGSIGGMSKQRGLRLESLEDMQHELKTQAALSSSMVKQDSQVREHRLNDW